MIGFEIRRIREAKGIKRLWLADQIGIDESTLCKIEQNRVTLSVPRLIEIASFLQVPIFEFFKEYDLSHGFQSELSRFEKDLLTEESALEKKQIADLIAQNSCLIKMLDESINGYKNKAI